VALFERSGNNSSCWGLNGRCGITAVSVVRVGAYFWIGLS